MNYKLLTEALEFYKEKGFIYTDVPWTASEEFINITLPKENKPFKLNDKYLIGSAEQSLLEQTYDLVLTPDIFRCAITPCFRDDLEDDLHQKTFMKLELFKTTNEISNLNHKETNHIIYSAYEFFNQFFDVKIVAIPGSTPSWDIIDAKNGIELGSYGVRFNPKLHLYWIYGTGIAEPRFSKVLERQ